MKKYYTDLSGKELILSDEYGNVNIVVWGESEKLRDDIEVFLTNEEEKVLFQGESDIYYVRRQNLKIA